MLKRIFHVAVCALSSFACAAPVAAQDYPVKPVRFKLEITKWAKVVRASGARPD